LNRKSRCTTDLLESRAIVFHRRIVWQASAQFPKDSGGMRVWRLYQPVMNPLAFATRGNHTRAAQISKMPRDLWLIYFQHFDEKAHANLIVSDKIYEAQASVIGERFEEKFQTVFLSSHVVFICRLVGLITTILNVS